MSQGPKEVGFWEAFFCIVAALGVVVLAGAIGGLVAPIRPHTHPIESDSLPVVEQTIAEANLLAQQEMANWAFGAMIGGFLAALVSLVALYFLRESLRKTRQTLKETQERNALEMRAYLVVEPKGIETWIGEKEVVGQIEIKNLGKSLAKNVSSQVHIKLGTYKEEEFKVRNYKNLAKRALPPDASMRQSSKNRLDFSDLQEGWPNCVYVFGCIYYTDHLGVRRTTKFCHRYNKSAVEQDMATLGMPEENLTVIDPKMARHHIHWNDAE